MQISQAAICTTTLGHRAVSVNPVLSITRPRGRLHGIVYAPSGLALDDSKATAYTRTAKCRKINTASAADSWFRDQM